MDGEMEIVEACCYGDKEVEGLLFCGCVFSQVGRERPIVMIREYQP